MQLIKENENGKTYQVKDMCKILYRNKWSISGDNKTNPKETIYLVSGKAEITLKEKIRRVEAPEIIKFPEKTYHKILALSDISLIVLAGNDC